MHIGVFGGSFNPVHRQHLQIALNVLKQTEIDEIWLVPVFSPVHKPGDELAGYEFRRLLLDEAIKEQGDVRIKISDAERDIAGPSYTINTVNYFLKTFPHNKFSLIIGGDSLCDLPDWRRIDELVKLCDFIVAARPGFSKTGSVADARLQWVDITPSSVSASEIRKKLAQGISHIAELYSGEYFIILLNNLYNCLNPAYARVVELINSKLSGLPDGLAVHTKGVARLAVELSCKYGARHRDALMAGLAHDLFRASPADEIFRFAAFCSRPLIDIQKQLPMLAHGPAAAGFLLANDVELPDEVIQAIYDHTFADMNSPFFTRLLAAADTLEPSRNFPGLASVLSDSQSFDALYSKVLQIKAERNK